jgi:hypothetical protein
MNSPTSRELDDLEHASPHASIIGRASLGAFETIVTSVSVRSHLSPQLATQSLLCLADHILRIASEINRQSPTSSTTTP